MSDVVQRVRDAVGQPHPPHLLIEAADEIERLASWKQEAIAGIAEWEKVYDALGQPGRLGESKAIASAHEVHRLRSENARLRAVQRIARTALDSKEDQ